jgi:hypothetical protein
MALIASTLPSRTFGKNRLHIDVHSEPGASMSWLTGWRSRDNPRLGEVDEDLQDAGGSCKTPKAMSSAQRKPGRRA